MSIILLCLRNEFASPIRIQSFSRGLASTHCLHMLHRRAKTKLGHVAIDTLKLIRVNGVRFVPDANASVCANRLVEFLPRCKMWIRRVMGKPLQVLEGTPVLDQHRSAKVPEEFRMQESFFRICK